MKLRTAVGCEMTLICFSGPRPQPIEIVISHYTDIEHDYSVFIFFIAWVEESPWPLSLFNKARFFARGDSNREKGLSIKRHTAKITFVINHCDNLALAVLLIHVRPHTTLIVEHCDMSFAADLIRLLYTQWFFILSWPSNLSLLRVCATYKLSHCTRINFNLRPSVLKKEVREENGR